VPRVSSFRRFVALFAVLVSAVGVVAACGSGDDTSAEPLEAYYTELDVNLDDFRGSSGAAFETLDGSSDLDELKAAFAELPVGLRQFLDGTASLTPPPAVAAAHADGRAAGEAFLSKMESVNDDVQATATLDEFVATAGNDDLASLNEGFNAQCRTLQRVADDNDVAVDLDCPEQ
jgi:hypothetical protein